MPSGAEIQLWELSHPHGRLRCTLRPGCNGFELVVVRRDEVLVREHYADRSTLGERAWMLRRQFEGE